MKTTQQNDLHFTSQEMWPVFNENEQHVDQKQKEQFQKVCLQFLKTFKLKVLKAISYQLKPFNGFNYSLTQNHGELLASIMSYHYKRNK